MRSSDHILTTHTGSLPRPAKLVDLMHDRYEGKPVDAEALDALVTEAVDQVVARQLELGIDVPSDGEMSKVAFNQYVHDRFSGFSEVGSVQGNLIDDLEDFPGVTELIFGNSKTLERGSRFFACVGPIEVKDRQAVYDDVERFRRSLGDKPPSEAFLNAPTPGQITFNFPNSFFPSHEEYLAAAAEAMRYEYKAIVEAGFNLQLDSPDCAMAAHVRSENTDLNDVHRHNVVAVEALNEAIRGLPPERIRLHICWGNYPGPHHRDVGLAEILPTLFGANVGTFSFEAANPRHAHESEVFERIDLPEGAAIMPGVIDVTTNRIEHPRLVAQRLIQFANLVGKENVIAGTDCGFGTIAGLGYVHHEVAWAKLGSLVEGARIASAELWG